MAAVGAVVWGVMRLHNPAAQAAPATPVNRVEALHAACVKDMVASTCKVMGTATSGNDSAQSKPGDLVFIAGVGAVSAVDYQQMYEAGAAMCNVVKKACLADWQSSRCQTARKLLGG